MKITGIYQIQSKIKPERIYVGSAISVGHRINCHLCDLRKNKHHSKKLQNHYNKYGESDLYFTILLGCEKENLITTEQYFIDSYKPYFNICKKAGNCLGNKASDETKQKMSVAHKGKNKSEEHKKRIGESHRINKKLVGRKITQEHRDKISQSLMGNKFALGNNPSIETKQKMRTSHIGINTWMKGKKLSEETRKKMSESHKGTKGFKHSTETIQKMKSRIPWNKGMKKILDISIN